MMYSAKAPGWVYSSQATPKTLRFFNLLIFQIVITAKHECVHVSALLVDDVLRFSAVDIIDNRLG